MFENPPKICHVLSNNHYEVYIKDQFESDPAWYYCHGMNSQPKKLTSDNVKNTIEIWNTHTSGFPKFFLYKKLEKQMYEPKNTTAINTFASALANVISV